MIADFHVLFHPDYFLDFFWTMDLSHFGIPSQALLKSCGSWSAVEDALQQLGLGQLEPFLRQNLGRHNAPTSPVVSVVLNILNADLWRQRLGKGQVERQGKSQKYITISPSTLLSKLV